MMLNKQYTLALEVGAAYIKIKIIIFREELCE